jgi:hypothetical protein
LRISIPHTPAQLIISSGTVNDKYLPIPSKLSFVGALIPIKDCKKYRNAVDIIELKIEVIIEAMAAPKICIWK